MWSFDKTCHITNTPINYEDWTEVVQIVLWENLSKAAKEWLYDFLQYYSNLQRDIKNETTQLENCKKENCGIEHIFQNRINEIKDILYDFQISIGYYNDYWSIENNEIESDPFSNVELFFHKWAIDFILWKDIKEIPKDKVIYEILIALYLYRRWLWLDLCLVWQQYSDSNEIKNLIELNNKTNQFLKEKLKRIEQ